MSYASRNLYPMNWKPVGTGRVVSGGGKEHKGEIKQTRKLRVTAKGKTETFNANRTAPTYFRDNGKDRVVNIPKGRGGATEVNRVDTIRNLGNTKGIITNASPNVPVYTHQGDSDPVVARMSRASDYRNRRLEKRRQAQHHARNVPIIVDRPLG